MKKWTTLIITFTVISLLSCDRKLSKNLSHPEVLSSESTSYREHLIIPVRLNKGLTEIVLDDFVDDNSKVKSALISTAPKNPLDFSSGTIAIDDRKLRLNPISFLRLELEDDHLDIPLIKSEKLNRTIKYKPTNVDQSVSIAGAFNSWSPQDMKLKDETYSFSSVFDPGDYPYQLVINGKWRTDPNNVDSVPNGFGAYNSLLKVNSDSKVEPSQIITSTYSGSTITLEMKNPTKTSYIALLDNTIIDQWTSDRHTAKILEIPPSALKEYRSHIRVYGFSNAGRTNDLLIPLENGKVISDASLLNRYDKHTQILYFMMVDRFFNGDSSIDDPIEDERVAKRANYQGGDLEGIYQKLNEGYFSELGVNTIWLSPITQNPLKAYQEYIEPRRFYSGYHGYWPINNRKVDHRLGDDFTLKKLVSRAHRDDVNVLLDFVSNHVHEEHTVYQNDTTVGTIFHLPDGQKNLRIWDGEQRLTTWFDTFLPSLDLQDETIAQMMVDTALYWMDEFDLDGYRHDATKHIPLSFWRLLTKELKNGTLQKKSIYQVGETFGNRELIGSYVGAGMLDGQFDFNLYFDARDILSQDASSFYRLQNSLEASLSYYGHHSLMANLSGNHDLPRFIAYASEALAYDENPQEAGWARDIKIENPIGYDRLELLHAFNMTIPGIPVIYYGDEIGMVGANDPDNRRMMRFDNLSDRERELKVRVSQLTNTRRSSMSLLYGDIEILLSEEDVLAYKRTYFNETTIVALNKSKEDRILILDPGSEGNENDQFLNDYGKTLKEGGLELKIPAYDYEIIKRK